MAGGYQHVWVAPYKTKSGKNVAGHYRSVKAGVLVFKKSGEGSKTISRKRLHQMYKGKAKGLGGYRTPGSGE